MITNVTESVDSGYLLYAFKKWGVTDIVSVPDSTQRHFLRVAGEEKMLISATTEDQALGIATGLRIAGRFPVISMQNSGVFACGNALRTIAHDMKVPTMLLIGLYRRNPQLMLSEHNSLALTALEKQLRIFGARIWYIDNEHNLDHTVLSDDGLSALLLGAPTA